MKKILVTASLILYLLPATGQYTEDTDTLKQAAINRIDIPEIASQATNLNSHLLDKQSLLLTEKEKENYRKNADTIIFKVNLQREDPRLTGLNLLSIRELSNLENEWKILKSRLNTIQSELTGRIRLLEKEKQSLLESLQKWQNTESYLKSAKSDEAVMEQVLASVGSIRAMNDRINNDTDFMQGILVSVSANIIFANGLIDNVESAQAEATRNLFQINKEPVWKIFGKQDKSQSISTSRSFISDTMTVLNDFVKTYSLRLFLHLLFAVIILFFIHYSFNNLMHALPDDRIPETDTIKTIIKRPVSSSFLIIFLITYLLYDNIPDTIGFVNLLFVLIPVLIILYNILTPRTRYFIWLPTAGTILIQVHLIIPGSNIASRLLLIFIIVFCILSLIWIIRGRSLKSYSLTKRISKLLYYLSLVGLIIMTMSLIAAISGAVMLAEFLSHATIRSAALILVFYAFNRTIESIIYTTIYSKRLKKLRIISQYHNEIYNTSTRLLIIVSWTVWMIFALKLFSVWDNIYSALVSFFTNEFRIGSLSVSLGDIIIFLFLIWFTLWLSRVVRILFESEIASRVKMKRGVPGAISLILRILIITIGFLIAIGAAGVGLDKLAILLGALGVGIGFGLQNIFNNLVSGIILAFERPIQEGDIIEVGEFWGTVKEIGIRASTIFTFDGAEVIVPNGNLISGEVINWTLTNQNRRAEVLVGVAYGTDPDKVLEILNTVVKDQGDILKEPAPLALFSGFGESSLDFRLLFWIPKAENRFIIQSKINVAVNKAFKEAGIEIPFPQRDIHLRSVDKPLIDDIKNKG